MDAERSSIQPFPGKSTQDCYDEFPFHVRAGTPIRESARPDREAAGAAYIRAELEAPATGLRRRPDLADRSDANRAFSAPRADLLKVIRQRSLDALDAA